MLETIWQIQLVRDIVYSIGLLVGVWVVVVVKRGSTRTIYQSTGERAATNYMVKTIQENDGKVVKHIREDNGQTWEVRTPDNETSYYTTINTDETV